MEKPKTSLIQSPLGIGARNIFKFHRLTRNGISLQTLFFQVGVLYAPKFIYIYIYIILEFCILAHVIQMDWHWGAPNV